MNEIFKVAIVGGGASGLLCATELVRGKTALSAGEVVVLEKCDRVGKKLIATGNGQGNLTNSSLTLDNYYGDKNFIRIFLSETENTNIEEYFYSLGIPLITAKDGKKYPLSKQANSVLDTLRAFLTANGVTIFTDFPVQKITGADGNFIIRSGDKTVRAEKVVLAVGGSAGKQFGTDGSAYSLITAFGHEKTAVYPSLVQIKTETDMIRGLKGLKEQAQITAYDGEKPLKTALGEVLFTEYGLSGNAVFQVSGHLSTAKNPSVKIEFLPDLTQEQTEKIIADRKKNAPFVTGEELLNGILAKRVGQAVIKNSLDKSPKGLANFLKNFRLKVTGNLGFNYAQVTKGGIKTDKINPYTYESKLCRGVHIVGEALDIDGDCGGYNLTFAFISGILSARAIKTGYAQNKEQ